MNKKNKKLMKDSGYDSILSPCSSFSFDFKRLMGANASTPKNDEENSTLFSPHNGISHIKATNGCESFCGKVDGYQVDYKETSVNSALLDYKNLTLIILISVFAIFVIAYKMVLVAIPYTNTENFYEVSSYAQETFSKILDWAQENQLRTRLNPLFCGLVVTIFTYVMVYLDSSIPGISPPSPISPNKKSNYVHQRSSSLSLNYLTAIAAGVVVSALMWYES